MSVVASVLACVALLQGCQGRDDGGPPDAGRVSRFELNAPRTGSVWPTSEASLSRDPSRGVRPFRDDVAPGAPADGDPVTGGERIKTDAETFSLNFVDTDLQDFVRMFFDEIMAAPVIVDPALTGRVTIRTRRPVSRKDAVQLARAVLAMNAARLVERDGTFRVSSDAASASSDAVEEFEVLTLRHVDSEQMRAALGAFGIDASRIVQIGDRVVLVAGSATETDRSAQVAASLDVDRLAGRSFSLRPMRSASARSAAGELTRMFASGDDDAFEAMPIERMNAVLLFGRSAATVRRAEVWLDRLDQGGDGQRRVHVYPVQNRAATDIAVVLQGIVAGLDGATLSRSASPPLPEADDGPDLDPTTQFTAAIPSSVDDSEGRADGSVAISADPATNSLVIVAADEDYELLRKAVDRLDVVPAQVLVEATIAEVTLNSALSRGVRWYFETGNHTFGLAGDRTLAPGPEVPGFNYLFTVPSARVVISALEGVTNVKIVSSPALTVLDNQTATLKIGDQVPIAVRSARSSENPLAPIVNEIEMRDTGIVLAVKPRISPSGLVQLDISQEISDVAATTTSSIGSPTIRQRAVTSNVVVQSGTDIVIGGLIADRTETARSGVPVLKDIPVLGEVFTARDSKSGLRTELLIVLRPVVLASTADVAAITAEIRSRISAD
jgi:general secretion pathway protein D